VELIRGSEEKHDQEALQFKFHGRVVILRDYTSRVTSFITTIGDIAINFAPAPSSIIWNALKVVLKVSSNISRWAHLRKLMDGLSERITSCRRPIHHGMHKSDPVSCQARHSVSRSLSWQSSSWLCPKRSEGEARQCVQILLGVSCFCTRLTKARKSGKASQSSR